MHRLAAAPRTATLRAALGRLARGGWPHGCAVLVRADALERQLAPARPDRHAMPRLNF